MSKNNVRIAIRDSTDSHNVAFFDNEAGIKYKSANLQRFLAGSASILTLKYNSKDIDSIRSGCKLAFRYKDRDYWLNVMNFEKKGFEVELTAYSLGLELNNETRGEHKPANDMSIAEYVAYYDQEHALTIGVNEVSDKRIKLEWTGTDTILARLFSIANSFGAELDFSVELNDDYSLKRQVLNIYKKGNLGTNKVSQPVRVGKELKVINYSDNIKELRTAVRATGKDGLTIDGLNKKIYDDNKELLYYSSGMTVYAPQSRDRFPSVGKGSNDNWIVEDLGETQYETKEALWGYMYGEIQKKSLPEITYEAEGTIEAGIGDTQTLIDDIHFEPALYVQARVSELEDDILTGKVTKSTFINFERKYSQIADSLLKQVEALAEDAAPYIIRLSTDNGFNFKNGKGTSTITAKLEKYSKIVNADWKWLINNSVVSETSSVTINASQVTGTLNVVAVATVDGNEVAREYITFTNSDDGVGIKSITRYYTTNNQAEGVTAGGQNWATKPTTVTTDKKYMWSYDVITYTNDTSLVTQPAVIGARGDDGLDADTTGITEALDKAKQELTALSANIEKVRDDSLAAVEEAKQQLTTVSNDLSTAKQDLQNAVSEVDTKATNLQSDLTKAKQDLTSQASQLTAQASAQSELTERVSSVEKTADGTKTTVSELSKTVAQNSKDITSVTSRTKTVEDDLTSTKTTLSQVKTTADNTSKKTATLETGLNGLTAKFENLKIGGTNLLLYSADPWQAPQTGYYQFYGTAKTSETYNGAVVYKTQGVWNRLGINLNNHLVERGLLKVGDVLTYSVLAKTDQETPIQSRLFVRYNNQSDTENISGKAETINLTNEWQKVSVTFTVTEKMLSEDHRVNYLGWEQTTNSESGKFVYYTCNKIERGNVATDYSPNEADLEQKVAEYKQNADQNYASLQTTVQNLDGTVQQNKTIADQTAQGFSTRIESLETYKDGENTRANQYFESAKTETARQLTAERTAIAKDYVAKSTYTSDVTGIRNDLTATTTTANTTKTNLANYQASNDTAVANLQSNLQTANGNISSLQTKVEAVPGQITSAVSAVEGKIPTEIGGRNLYALSKNSPIWFNEISNLAQNIATGEISFKVTGRDPFFGTQADKNVAFGYRGVKIPVKTGQDIAVQLTNELFTKNFVSYFGDDDKAVKNFKAYQTNKFVIPASELEGVSYVAFRFGIKEDTQEVGSVHSTKVKVEYGNVYTDWSPAPEDTASQIGSLSSQIQQTADGMTLLATKTELNSAKSELQSGISTATSKADSAQATANSNAQTISTHTTQISALNTGLSAKVSQTDFNTLSGRVTTAENNITAKANELSSKITSVEGKIPTSVGGTNLLLYSADPWKAPNDYYQSIGAVKTDETLNGSIVYKTHTAWTSLRSNWGKQLIDRKNVKVGDEFTYSIYAKTDQSSMKVCLVARFSEAGETAALSDVISLTNEWQKLSVTFKVTQKMVASQSKLNWVGFEQVTNSEDGKFVYYACNKLERGNIATDYSPNPEDYDSKLATAQSEIKQTTDSISASVSSVQVTASNAQSTANTAVSKADAAQAGVNTLDSTTVKTASLTINTDGIVMKAGKSTTDVANAIGSYFAVNQNAINLFADKIKVKGDMIVDGSITADKFKGNQITSLNGATTLNLYTGEIIFNNQYATINQIKGSYKSQISLSSVDYKAVNESAWSSVNMLAFNSTKLTSATRRAGSAVDMFSKFSLMTLYGEKIAFTGETSGIPNSQNAIIVNTNSDDVSFTNSQTNSSEGAWNYSMIMDFGANAAISAPDIKLAGHFKSLTGILDDLCKKVGVMWI
ncbi:Chromosome partition protein Smc [Streptococcus infantarius subsp. infantarius]|nr:Chromosome partition protein Smc [Streptococcus infantarius subsp. infantarius]